MGHLAVVERSLMSADLLNLYTRAADWTAEKVAGVTDLSESTPCPEWRVRDLLNHMLDTQRYFAGSARGEDAALPAPPRRPSSRTTRPRTSHVPAQMSWTPTPETVSCGEQVPRWVSRSAISC